MRLRFWGTRGSVAAAGPETVRYGGNTACVEARTESGTLFILDCGTGARKLGQTLAAAGPVRAHLLIGHTHADHIQGLPFFLPAFVAGSHLTIYGPAGLDRDFPSAMGGQMDYAYFPVPMRDLPARIEFVELDEGEFVVDGVRVIARHLNHTAPCLGYRLESGGVTLAYSTDHEPFAPMWGRDTRLVHPRDRAHVEFLAGADLVIHDAQYAEVEYSARIGWGHSTVEYAVAVTRAAAARRLALFHHDPARSDVALDRIMADARAAARDQFEVVAAAEGLAIDLPEYAPRERPTLAPSAPRVPARARVLVADDDESAVRLLEVALREDGYEIVSARDGAEAVSAAAQHPFDLILLDVAMPGVDGLAACRAIRNQIGLRDVPIVMVTALEGPDDIGAAFREGATDYIAKPFAVAQLRARVRNWLARGPSGGGAA